MNVLLIIIAVLLCVQIALFVWMIRLLMVHKRILIPLAEYDRMIIQLNARWHREKAVFMRQMMEKGWRDDMLLKKYL